MIRPTSLTPADVAQMIAEECSDPAGDTYTSLSDDVQFLVGGIVETHNAEERRRMAVALWKMVHRGIYNGEEERRVRSAASGIFPGNSPQACFTCEKIFSTYDDEGRCPRCGSGDCGALEGLL